MGHQWIFWVRLFIGRKTWTNALKPTMDLIESMLKVQAVSQTRPLNHVSFRCKPSIWQIEHSISMLEGQDQPVQGDKSTL